MCDACILCSRNKSLQVGSILCLIVWALATYRNNRFLIYLVTAQLNTRAYVHTYKCVHACMCAHACMYIYQSIYLTHSLCKFSTEKELFPFSSTPNLMGDLQSRKLSRTIHPTLGRGKGTSPDKSDHAKFSHFTSDIKSVENSKTEL